MEKSFSSQILEYLGYFAAFGVAISQYVFKESFQVFFGNEHQLYSISSLTALLLSFAIIIAIFENRYILSSKRYFRKKSQSAYLKSIREDALQHDGKVQGYFEEPRGYSIKQIGIVLIMLSFVFFYVFISSSNVKVISIVYVAFVVSIVSSISMYATSLYLQNDLKIREKLKKDLILAKIQEHFAGDIKINASWVDNSNILTPLRRMVIERGPKKYTVVVNSNDPELLFSVEEVNPPSA